jgi:GTP diphosphokinase / guanosine-3',5'-bis(diphosphate) 3'-diphosphatase
MELQTQDPRKVSSSSQDDITRLDSYAIQTESHQVATLGSLTEKIAYLGEDNIKRIRDAYRQSDEAHLGQFRSSGEPYISHPIAVAEICAGWRLDTESLMAALLHDVLEDTSVTKQELMERFGVVVADLVDGLSKLERVHFSSKEQQQAESFRKMLLAMARDLRVILIKLADRLHNMRTLQGLSRAKKERVARETIDIYAPIAHRLGFYALYRELLDRGFEALHPMRSRILRQAMLNARRNRREVLTEIFAQVQNALPEHGMAAEVYGREKTLHSIHEKMKAKGLSFAQVLDVYGFRVIVEDRLSCYSALGVLHSLFKPMPGRFKDYVANPKANGYQSLHTTLVGPSGAPVEFQIRSKEMQRFAEAGVAAHWLYKSDVQSFSDLHQLTHQWLRSLLDIQSNTGDAIEFIEHVKVDLFPDEVFVFTPRGEIRSLTRGATVLDYAFIVHTDVGRHAVSARINHKEAALSTELRNSDVVEVITDRSVNPGPESLNWVKTGKARAEIRQYLRRTQGKESIEMGQRLLEQALASLRIDAAALPTSVLDKSAQDGGLKNVEELYSEIGLAKRLAQVEARAIALRLGGKTAAAMLLPKLAPVMIQGSEHGAIHFAPCCSPLPDEPIIGQLKGGHGLTIHRMNCSTAERIKERDPERWIGVKWSDGSAHSSYKCRLEILVKNERGALGKIAAEIAASEANMSGVSSDEAAQNLATLKVVLEVRDRIHLARVMRNLRQLKEVLRISRPG